MGSRFRSWGGGGVTQVLMHAHAHPHETGHAAFLQLEISTAEFGQFAQSSEALGFGFWGFRV